MPGVPGVTVVTMLVCFFILHARLRAHQTPGIPCALLLEGNGDFWQGSGETSREIADTCLHVIARSESDEAIHSFLERPDGLLRSARNDGATTGCLKNEPLLRRPCESRDPCAAAYRLRLYCETPSYNYRLPGLWVPAFAGTTKVKGTVAPHQSKQKKPNIPATMNPAPATSISVAKRMSECKFEA